MPSSITKIANSFFAACEAGKGWEDCKDFCTPNATFMSQAEPLANVLTLEAYTNWMKDLLTVLTDGSYIIKSFATDEERQNVCAYAVFTGTHLAGGPVAPTGKMTETDYVYVMQFAGNKVTHMTKIWNSGVALKELGWG